MQERVDVREWIEFQWPYLLTFLGGAAKVERLARQTGAFERARRIGSPEALLRLILMWAVGERSLMDTAAMAAEAGLAEVSDVALVKRIAKAGDWLGALLGEALIDCRAELPHGLRVRLLDATSITRAGKRTTDHRVHLGLDLGTNRIDSIELTDAKGVEGLERFAMAGGEILIGDRAYGTRGGMASAAERGAYFIVRFGWPSVPLLTPDGQPFSLFEALESLPDARAGEFRVQFQAPEGALVPVRLVAIRKSEAAAQQARQRALREKTRKSRQQVDPRTLMAAGYVFVLTNLPDSVRPESVLQLYRLRWQIEMKFKTLKSLLHLDQVPARTDQALRVYVCAKLLVALLIDSLIDQVESFSPWGYPIVSDEPLASDPAPA